MLAVVTTWGPLSWIMYFLSVPKKPKLSHIMWCETKSRNFYDVMYHLCLSYFLFFIIVFVSGCSGELAFRIILILQSRKWIGRKILRQKLWCQAFFRKYSLCSFQVSEWQLTVCFFCSWQAAKLPMSIIIVGVGQAEFDGENSNYKVLWGNICKKNKQTNKKRWKPVCCVFALAVVCFYSNKLSLATQVISYSTHSMNIFFSLTSFLID